MQAFSLRHSESTGIHPETNIEQFEEELELDLEPPEEPLHVLALFKRKTIQMSTFCEIEQKWERTANKIDLTHNIESFRDAFMVSIGEKLVIFYMRNGVLSQVQRLALDSSAVENITLPNGAECAGLALFCHLNDKIFCFARTDQQFFHM